MQDPAAQDLALGSKARRSRLVAFGDQRLHEVLVGAQPELEHPVRLLLEAADLLDGLARQAAFRLGQVDDLVVEGEFLAAVSDDLAGGCHQLSGSD